ncbi:flavodoxin family protein [Amycolatopsis benzoatilytica]|uniref:flavodoxin family protein n=1 Tax=Amycolatopsis benzoatilytica TaxID=346045 RepID=UPI00035C9395|nr:NAD(P)H-dependent oxidoreductase [Amycolatopsis benzoatilytica]
MSTRILVVYYSATGNTAALAGALAEGAASTGAEVRVRTVPESAPAEAVASNRRWQAWVGTGPHHDLAALADLEWADGLALGSPTRFGGPAAQLKSFVDTTGGLWAQGKLADKVATSFTSRGIRTGSFVSGKSAAPDSVALQALRLQGQRLATVASHVATGLKKLD